MILALYLPYIFFLCAQIFHFSIPNIIVTSAYSCIKAVLDSSAYWMFLDSSRENSALHVYRNLLSFSYAHWLYTSSTGLSTWVCALCISLFRGFSQLLPAALPEFLSFVKVRVMLYITQFRLCSLPNISPEITARPDWNPAIHMQAIVHSAFLTYLHLLQSPDENVLSSSGPLIYYLQK